MPLTAAQAGHGATIAMELTPVATPGVFTVIAELNGDIKWPDVTRPETDVTSHQSTIDNWIFGVMQRGPLTFSVNFVYNTATHDHLTGLYYAMLINERRGFRLRGPNGSAGVDEWVASGNIQSITNTSPIREGARSAEVTVRLSGPMIVGAVAYGT